MKLLLLAPQPCYIDRGTPIAVDLTLATLSGAGHDVDLLTFPGGEDRTYPGLRIFRAGHRISKTPVRPGLSAKKLLLDVFMLGTALRLAATNRYDLVHAVEESSFIALVLKVVFRIPYLSDMDSRMTTQLTDRFTWLRPLDKLLWAMESLPIRFASGVVTMCDSLRDQVRPVRENNVFVVKDVSLLDYYSASGLKPPPKLDEVRELHRNVLMYIGNLESYQGIDLLLEAFASLTAKDQHQETALVVIGGDNNRILEYQKRSNSLNIGQQTFFLGHQPVGLLKALTVKADVLISPRIQGINTPLKIYSYLDSGVPVLATDLQTHTQVVNPDQAKLCAATPEAMANAIDELLANPEQRKNLARNARQLVAEQHSVEVFRRQMLNIYGELTGSTMQPSEATPELPPEQHGDNQKLQENSRARAG